MDNRLVLPPKSMLDCYRIVRVVGAGGFGITYEAEDIGLGAPVALKEYYPAEFGDRDARMSIRPKSDRHKATFEWGRTSFLQEARMLARFSHSSIVRVSRVFEANSTAYMVMSFERGDSFEDWLKRLGRPPSQEELDRIAAPLLDALEAMHAVDFLHRDIAPDNIIVRPDGSPVLLDFGAARRAIGEMSRALTGIVKAGYSPQEQYATDSRLQGPWSDLYAFGGTLYRAVTGKAPEEATLRSMESSMPSATEAAVGDFRRDFLTAIDTCLNVRIAERPQNVSALRPLLLDEGAAGNPPSSRLSSARSAPAAARGFMLHRWHVLAAATTVVAGILGAVTLLNHPAVRPHNLEAERNASVNPPKVFPPSPIPRTNHNAPLPDQSKQLDADVLERNFVASASEGDWDRLEPLAKALLQARPAHRLAHLFLGLADFKARRLGSADEHFKSANDSGMGELTSLLARAWLYQANGRLDEGLGLLGAPSQPEWARDYMRFHRAMLLDVAGRSTEAATIYQSLVRDGKSTHRILLAYAYHAGNAGDTKLALKLLNTSTVGAGGELPPISRALQLQIEAGVRPQLLVKTSTQGLAEALYGLGESLTGTRATDAAFIYLRFALYLDPGSIAALVALGYAYETTKQYDLALTIYDSIPRTTTLQLDIDIRKALLLSELKRVDDAQRLLEGAMRRDTKDPRPLEALGNIMRTHKRFADAIEYYTRAIALIGKPEPKHWTYFYQRGTCYERNGTWSLAEADLLQALRLSPDQPMTLNYLGYSWVEQRRNLKQAMGYLEKAVRLKPDDGYIVDSLGWAHFRNGNFKEALRYVQRAVEIQPKDPVLNDHLGDIFWKLGRSVEARAQWEKTLTLDPEAEDLIRIRSKIAQGLVEK